LKDPRENILISLQSDKTTRESTYLGTFLHQP